MTSSPLKNPATESLAQELAALLPDKAAANARFQQFAEQNPGLKKWEASATVERARALHEQFKEHAAFPYPANESRIPATIKRTKIGFRFNRLVYQCPDSCWQTHSAEWRKAQGENPEAPEPFPFKHCVFEPIALP